jgi:hypothetical protein
MGGCADANGIFVAAEGLDVFRLGVTATGGRWSHQAICPLWKYLCLVGCLGVEPRKIGIALAEGLHYWGGRAVPLLNYAVALALQLSKSTENLSQDSWVPRSHSLRRLGCLYRNSDQESLINIPVCQYDASSWLARWSIRGRSQTRFSEQHKAEID